MAFVRSKVVEGRTYYQLVHNHRATGKHRQKVLCHLGKHSALESAIEDMSRKEAELRTRRDKAFRKTTEIKRNILVRYSEIIDKEIPSLDEAWARVDEALNYLYEYDFMEDKPAKYSAEYEDYRVELEKRKRKFFRSVSFAKVVERYHRTMREAERYHDRADEAQEKKGKLTDYKKKYPHL